MLNFEVMDQAIAANDPFPYLVATNVLAENALRLVQKNFPDIRNPGVFPLSELTLLPKFKALIEEIESPAMRQIIEQKFDIDLKNKPLMITVRGQCHKKDGRIHTDSKDKIITCLLYLNDKWDEAGARLRLLRNDHDLDDMIAEVPPNGGSLIAFKRTENSWHGHYPFEGQRRCIMFNWLTSEATLGKNLLRHKLSSKIKKHMGRRTERDNY